MTIITLLTDFGQSDTYVAQMKGVILSIAPSATLVDITHSVPPQDVPAGGFLLWTAVLAFAAGTVHVGVVDPGVGSSRSAIAIQTVRGDCLVGPDNGLLMPAAERLGGMASAVQLATPAAASATFHGRDIFAPAAARLAIGEACQSLGPLARDFVQLSLPVATSDVGQVIHVDTYGNLVTNFRADDLPAQYEVEIGNRRVAPKTHYAAVAFGELLALVGSAGLLEISVRDGSAASITGAERGTPVTIRRRPPQPG